MIEGGNYYVYHEVTVRIDKRLNVWLDEEPADPAALRDATGRARQKMKEARRAAAENPDATALGSLARDVGRLGDLLRVGGHLQEAEALLGEAVDMLSLIHI